MRPLLLLFLILLCAAPVFGQRVAEPPPRIELAEFHFERGLQAYGQGDFAGAHRHFAQVATDFPFNRKTTPALLMAGKALYEQGEYERAAELMDAFLRDYPESRYAGEVRRVLDLARRETTPGLRSRDRVFDLGIALPLRPDDVPFTQALFNGIRIAVDEHNAAYPGRPVRMIFRNSYAQPSRTEEAVSQLAGEAHADAVIGPLYSDEAMAAAAVAERLQLPLLAPLATDEQVSAGRRFAFQANPTFSMRARRMARHAVEKLGYRRIGVIGQQGEFSEQMAQAFREEALRLRASVPYFHLLPSARAWSRLPQEVGADTLKRLDLAALYLPTTGEAAPELAAAALRGLGQMTATVRALGNAEWHDLEAARLASRLRTVYTNDFYVDPMDADARLFARRYEELAGEEPDRLGYLGYDLTRFLLVRFLQGQPTDSLRDLIQAAPVYQGLAHRIDFRNGNVNEGIFFLGYRNNAVVLLE